MRTLFEAALLAMRLILPSRTLSQVPNHHEQIHRAAFTALLGLTSPKISVTLAAQHF